MNVSLEISEIHPDLNFKVTNLRDHMAARESQEAAQ
jgi:5-carboxymethyl-2-hydroxymuconate isomerase